MTGESSSELVSKGPCGDCGSSDACALYTDDHTHCFSCGKTSQGSGGSQVARPRERNKDLLQHTYIAIKDRKIHQETCQKYGYGVGRLRDGTGVHIADYRDPVGHNIVAQHTRGDGKKFGWIGDHKDVCELWGKHLWRPGGKRVVVTEGELDCLSVAQVQGLKWPVVSLANGAQSAAKAFKQNLEWLNSFEEVVIMFDMDDAGREAVSKVVSLLSPGKARIAELPRKDASDCLVSGESEAIIQAIWQARVWRPEGIVRVKDVKAQALTPPKMGYRWFCPTLTAVTYGRRLGELVAVGAGTSVGKTDFLMQQLAHDIEVEKVKTAIFAFEQQPSETVVRVAGKIDGQPYHIPEDSRVDWSQLSETIDRIDAADRLYLYDHFGGADWEQVKSRIEYLATTEGVQFFYIDNLTALADPAKERESLETIMKDLGTLMKRLNIWICIVSHLATPDGGKSHEEGAQVAIRHFKGARAIGFWCLYMFGLERNTQSEDPEERHTVTLRCLKDRNTGRSTGQIIKLRYDPETCLLVDEGFADGKAKKKTKGQPQDAAGDDDDIPF